MKLDLSNISNEKIHLTIDKESYEYIRKGLPPSIFNLLIDFREKSIRDIIDRVNNPGGFSGGASTLHSPPVATRGTPSSFPVNMASKGIGFIPREDFLKDRVEQFDSLINEALENGDDSNREERLNTLLEFYTQREKIDNRMLGTLELYGIRSWRNLQYDPRISILYNTVMESENRPNYISFEVRGVVEVVEKESLRWRWQRNVHDLFHLYKAKERREGDWPVAVLTIHVLKVIDKRPYPTPSQEIID